MDVLLVEKLYYFSCRCCQGWGVCFLILDWNESVRLNLSPPPSSVSLQLKRPHRDSCSSDELIPVTVLPPSERLHRESTVAARTERWDFWEEHTEALRVCFAAIPAQEAQSDWRQCHVFHPTHLIQGPTLLCVCVVILKFFRGDSRWGRSIADVSFWEHG